MEHPLIAGNEASKTKNRIMLEASILFASHGYAAVSIRDIAAKVGIQPASLYNHFESKEALFEAIIDNIKEIYLDFYVRMDEMIAGARSFADVLDCLFSELRDVYHIFIYYGISLVVTEQFRNKKARSVYHDVLMKIGVNYTKRKFDECIKKQWVKEFDTEGMAMLFTNTVLVGTLMRTHEDLGHKTAFDPSAMFATLQRYMLNSVEIIP